MHAVESEIEKYLQTKCKKFDILYYKFTSPANSGVPDRVLIGYGKTVFVELKRPPIKSHVFKPRPLQIATFKSMRDHGATVYVIDTKEKANELIKELVPKSVLNSQKTQTNLQNSAFKIYSIS